MNLFLLKIRLIFVPFLLTALISIASFTYLNWYLIVYLNYKIDEETFSLLIPLIGSWLPVILLLRPRVKYLNLKVQGRRDPVLAILMLSWGIIAAATIFSQYYMLSATGKLTVLNYASDIHQHKPTKYYTVKQFYPSKKFAHVKTYIWVSGKNNTDYNISIYVPVPVFDKLFPDTNLIKSIPAAHINALVVIDDTLSSMSVLNKLPVDSIRYMQFESPLMVMPIYGDNGKNGAIAVVTRGFKMKQKLPVQKIAPPFWLAVNYKTTVSNRLSLTEKNKAYRRLLLSSYRDFMNTPLNNFQYLDRVPYSKDLQRYDSAIALYKDVDRIETPVILKPVYAPFAQHTGNTLNTVLTILAIGSVVFLIIIACIKLKASVIAIETRQDSVVQ